MRKLAGSSDVIICLPARLYQSSLVGQSIFQPLMAIVEMATFTHKVETKLTDIFKDVETIDLKLFQEAKSALSALADEIGNKVIGTGGSFGSETKHKFKVKFCGQGVELVAEPVHRVGLGWRGHIVCLPTYIAI